MNGGLTGMPALAPIPYEIIGECFRNRSVVPFLGAAASSVGADETVAVPDGRAFAKFLADRGQYPGSSSDPLTKIAQYIQEIPADRDFLLSRIEAVFYRGLSASYTSCLTTFLGSLPVEYMPRLITTTNYDVLVERAFEARQIPYLAISSIMRNTKYAGRFMAYRTLNETGPECILTRTQVEEMLMTMSQKEPDTTLIYKMHGTARLRAHSNDGRDFFVDSVVLTETDYVEFLEDDRLNKVPSRILNDLRRSNLLFLGYSLEDWNFRVLLQRLQRIQAKQKESQKRHWACRLLEKHDDVEDRFWKLRGVEVYSISLDVFLAHLQLVLSEQKHD